jgi:SH3-like domain-containing protein
MAFNSPDLTASLELEPRSISLPEAAVNTGKFPTSELAGVNFALAYQTEFAAASSGDSPSAAAEDDDKEWVEVIDAVNMRSGPSSAKPVLRVQMAGARLQVASRDGRWVEVVEPDTGQRGWVFERHVKLVEASSRRAAIAGTEIQ